MRLVAALALLLPAAAGAAFEEKPLSAASAAMGEASTGDAAGPGAWLSNPAALSFLARPGAELSHTRLLGAAELPFSAASAAVPADRGRAWGGWASRFGDAAYGEWEAGAAAAFRAGPGVSVGAAAGVYGLHVARYGDAARWGLDAGLLARPHPRASWGISVRRINRPSLPGAREGLPTITRGGLSWAVTRAARLNADLVKPGPRPFSGRAGMEAALAPGFLVRLGMETRPARYALGFGAAAGPGRIDYAFLSHPFLGDQHQVSTSFSWGRTPP